MRPPPPSLVTSALALLCGACGSDFVLRGRDDEVDEPVYVTERFEQQASPQADVLWVVANTPSMTEEQGALAEAFPDFVAALDAAGLGYQLGVITSDGAGDEAGVLQGDPWIITPSSADPAADFARAVAVGVAGPGPEAGLAALVLALSEPLRSELNRGFRRPGAVLQVVVVSDDDDESDAVLGEDALAATLALLEAEAAQSGVAALSAVVGDPSGGCAGSGGAARPGVRYAAAAESSGGVVADICAADLDAVVAQLGALSVVYPREFPLQAQPWGDDVRVAVDGRRVDGGWRVDTALQALVFDEAPEAGSVVEVRYALSPEGGA